MVQTMVASANTGLNQIDWFERLQQIAYAYGKPEISGRIKLSPDHFIVTEVMNVEPTGQGEHYWLDITKTRLNTDTVAKSLARFGRVSNRNVGYSGMKDFHAITRQWFSVWKPGSDELDWSEYVLEGVTINRAIKHTRKIKRGTHSANHFQIRIVELSGSENPHIILNSRLDQIKANGVPNYFGEQRFGRNANNMLQAIEMFAGKRVKQRSLRSILLSSARSWLFNSVVSARVDAGTWQSLYAGEPANLNGSNSVFLVSDVDAENERLSRLDIHPTAPLWGEIKAGKEGVAGQDLRRLEHVALRDYQPLMDGLERSGVEYQRRATRLLPKRLQWSFDQGDLCLSFELQRGQFATSVLRELVCET